MREINEGTLTFQHPFMLTLCGPSQSGKTYWLYKLLKHVDAMITPVIDKVVFLYSTYQSLYDEIREEIKKNDRPIEVVFIDCSKGIPTISDIQKNKHQNTLVILDDLMTIAASSKENTTRLDNLSCRDAHHSNMSVIFVCQNLNYGNGKLRTARVNSQYIVCFKNLADRRNMRTLAENKQISPQLFNTVLKDIDNDPHGYLLFDNCAYGYCNARVRTNIFPYEQTIIYDL